MVVSCWGEKAFCGPMMKTQSLVRSCLWTVNFTSFSFFSHPLQVRERWFVCGGVQAATSPTDIHSEQVSALQLRTVWLLMWGNC